MVSERAVLPPAGPLTRVPPDKTVTLFTLTLLSAVMVNPEQTTAESVAPGAVADATPPQAEVDQLAATAKSPDTLE